MVGLYVVHKKLPKKLRSTDPRNGSQLIHKLESNVQQFLKQYIPKWYKVLSRNFEIKDLKKSYIVDECFIVDITEYDCCLVGECRGWTDAYWDGDNDFVSNCNVCEKAADDLMKVVIDKNSLYEFNAKLKSYMKHFNEVHNN